jgi:ligand-binding sensor domain-containing protein
MKWLLSVLSLLLIVTTTTAQDFHFKTYTTKEGLSSNDIRHVVQDSSGFLWIATGNGLNRFDGNAFDHFYHDPNNKSSIPSNEVVSLYIDKAHTLWAGSLAGISHYDPVRQQFNSYYPDSSLGKCGRWFVSMQEDNSGKLWVGSWYELLIFDTATKKFQRSGWADFATTHKPATGNNNRIVVLGLLPKAKTELWVLTTYGLYSVNTDTKQFTWYPYSGHDDFFGCQLNYIDETGSLWIATYNNGLLYMDAKTKKWTKHIPPANWNSTAGFNWSYGVTPVGNDTLMYCSLDGIAFFNKKTNQFISQLKNEAGNPYSYPLLRTFYIHPDKTGDYWLASTGGLVKMYTGQNTFKKINPLGEGSYLNRVFQISGRQSELVFFDPKRSAIIRWNENTKQFSVIVTPDGKTINSEPITWRQEGDYAWLSTYENLYQLNLLTDKATLIQLPPSLFPDNERTVRNTVQDEKGNLWIRIRTQGIVRYDLAQGKSEYAKFIPPELEKSYTAIYYNKWQHCLWVAVEYGGLYQFNVESGKTRYFPLYQQQGVNPATITFIVSAGNGNMYMSDASNGLFYYTSNNNSFEHFTRQDGLPGNNCNSLAMDKNGFLWIATSQGLSRYDTASKSFLNFAGDDMLPSYLAFISTADNENFYTCSGNSYYKWNCNAISSQPGNAPLYIRHITVNNTGVPIKNAYALSYFENNITIQAGVLAPDTNGPADLEYSLNDGSDWIKMENSHTVNFSKLAPGNYTIRLRQKGNANLLTILFRIQSPWWKKGWFITTALLLVVLAGAILLKRRITAIQKEALLKQKVAETEMMALRAQMNPHFIFNCISSIDNFIQDNDKENASAWLNKFAKLIRSILDSSKNEVIPFWKDWETLQLYLELEQLRSDDKFTVEMKAADELLNGHYRIPPLIIQPYVENAIHHGLLHRHDTKGLLKISATLQNSQLVYTIEDNGIGRQKAAALNALNRLNHNSYGMQMSKERIALFNEQSSDQVTITDLTNTAGEAAGTKADIRLNV